jgi:hypothetical protein
MEAKSVLVALMPQLQFMVYESELVGVVQDASEEVNAV